MGEDCRCLETSSERLERAAKASPTIRITSARFFGTKLRQQVEITQRHFHQLKLSTQGMAVHIGDATKALLTWSGIMGVVGGIASYATVQGFNDLRRRRSRSEWAGCRLARMSVRSTPSIELQRLGVDGFLENLATTENFTRR